MKTPWVPHLWPPPHMNCDVSFANFPPSGDLPDPTGKRVSLDSAWRMHERAGVGGTGDTGRLIAETCKEYRDARNYGLLVPFHQFEFYFQTAEGRASLYVRCPAWWDENWTSPSIAVPLPPVLTYRARMLLPEKEGTPEAEFLWRVFELEWTVLGFRRWCADIAEREIQWRLPPRARAGNTEFVLENCFPISPYSQTTFQEWLLVHDSYKWELRQQSHLVRGPGGNNPAQQETREELLQFLYPNKQNMPQLPNVPSFRLAPLCLPLHPSVLRLLTKERRKSSYRTSSCFPLFACTNRVVRNPTAVRLCPAAGSPEFPEAMAVGRHGLKSRTRHTIVVTLLELRHWPQLFFRACSSASTRRDIRISCRDTPASFSAKTRGPRKYSAINQISAFVRLRASRKARTGNAPCAS
jgi:hypothetical protein